MQIQQVPLASIIPYPNNARTHGTAQIELLAGSIQEFGFDQPIVLDSNNVIVKGHGRYQAAKRLGLETVPAIVVEDLSPAQVRASRIADNRIAELSNWDRELLESEIDILIEDGFDVSLLGFGDEDDMNLPGDEEEPEDELSEIEDELNSVQDDRYPLPIVLSWAEHQEWKAMKESLGERSDRAAFLKLIRN